MQTIYLLIYSVYFNISWKILFLFLNVIPSLSDAKTRVFDFDLRIIDLAPDGFTRPVWTVNEQFPGPPIIVTKGDRIIINVNNYLDDSTGIHAHGIPQYETTWYDGAVGTTQCGIPPNSSFTYDFTVEGLHGTYWYHAHYVAQYTDGIFGALIVQDPDDPYLDEYDEEFIVLVHDWYHKTSRELMDVYFSEESNGLVPNPDSCLINGKNSYNCSSAPEGSKCVSDAPLETFTFVPGKRYLLRVINTSAFARFLFSIDNHTMDVVEVEGSYTQRITLDSLPLNAGQRTSVIVKADQEVSNYFMRSAIHLGFVSDVIPIYNHAIVYYSGSDNSEPKTTFWPNSQNLSMSDWYDLDQLVNLKPYYPETLPESTHTVTISWNCIDDDLGVSRGYVNGSSYIPDYNISTLDKVFLGINDFDANQNIYEFFSYQETVDIVLINYDEGEHPLHLHGHSFWVLASERSSSVVDPSKFNLIDPIKRDSATLPEYGWIVIRFVANNPGVWAFHCHIEWHVEGGLVSQFIELPDKIIQRNPPEAWTKLCKRSNSTNIVGSSRRSKGTWVKSQSQRKLK